MICICISGKIGSGKSTTSSKLKEYLTANTNWNVVESNFADSLKEVCAVEAGVPIETFKTQEGKNTFLDKVGMRGGEFLQHVGKRERLKDPDHWIKLLFDASRGRNPGNTCLIIGDLRMQNEAFHAKLHNAILIRLNGDPNGVNAHTTRNREDISEVDLDQYPEFDCVIDTNATSPDEVLNQIVAHLRAKNLLT